MGRRKVTRTRERHIYCIPDIDPALLRRVRLYAIAKDIPLYKAFDLLLWRGLAAEPSVKNSGTKKVNVFVAETNLDA
jgi:hypothetical protein